MRSINKVILIGYIGKEPEIHNLKNGNMIVNVTLATSENWKDKQTGEKKEKTEWHKVVIFGKLAEIASEYLHKGTQIYIEGKLQTKKWKDNNNIDRYNTEIIVNNFTGNMIMLGKNKYINKEINNNMFYKNKLKNQNNNFDKSIENLEKDNSFDNSFEDLEKDNTLDNNFEEVKKNNNFDKSIENLEKDNSFDNSFEDLEKDNSFDIDKSIEDLEKNNSFDIDKSIENLEKDNTFDNNFDNNIEDLERDDTF